MGKFAIFSDLHIHPWNAFAGFNEDGLNTRLLDVADTLHWILTEAERAKCDAVLFAGDFWHTKKIDIETLHVAVETLGKTSIPLVMIPGNHDEADKYGKFHASKCLKGRAIILDNDSDGINIAGVRIVGLPYLGHNFADGLRDQIEDCGEPDILLLHAPVADAMMGSDFLTHEGDGVSQEKLFGESPLTIVGHYHQAQVFRAGHPTQIPSNTGDSYQVSKSPTVLIPGAPLQHNMGDRNTARGFWIYDGEFVRFHESKAPKFINVTADEASKLPEETFKNNFVTITAEDHRDAEKAAKKITNAKGIVYGTAERKILETSQRIEFKDKSDYKSTLKQYCETMGQSSAEVQELGVKILEEARKQ